MKDYLLRYNIISSASHPFYTGEQRQTSNEGRVANFNKRFARFNRSH